MDEHTGGRQAAECLPPAPGIQTRGEAMPPADQTTHDRRPPSMEEIVAEQRRRLEEARKAMHQAAKDSANHEVLDKGKGHGGGACLHF